MPYDNTNQIALFKNANKQQDNHPDYTGTLNVDGREFFVDCWLKEIKNGEKAGQKFLSGKVKPKQQRGGGGNQGGGYKSQQQRGQRPHQGGNGFDDDPIPFAKPHHLTLGVA